LYKNLVIDFRGKANEILLIKGAQTRGLSLVTCNDDIPRNRMSKTKYKRHKNQAFNILLHVDLNKQVFKHGSARKPQGITE
jgi:hypothetical protein